MSFLSKLFNSEKKDTTYSGPKPAASLLDVAGGKDYYNTILGRSQGRGVGFGDTYAQKYANPIIQNSRANFQDYTMPELNSELTATGRRRGSSGFQQIAQAQKEQGLAENDIFSRLQQRNEDQMRSEQSQAISQLGDFNRGDYNARNILANFENADNNRQVQEANQRRANEATGLQNLIYAGSDSISSMFGGGQGVGQRQAPQVASYGGGNPNVGFGNSGNSYNQRLLQRYAQAGRVR